jgi:FMN reductase
VTPPTILGIVGNPRPESRTHHLCRTLAQALADAVPDGAATDEVDLAVLGPRTLDPDDAQAVAAVERVLAADVLVLASPTYKATYSGLLKGFLDRIGTGALAGVPAVPIMLGGGPGHRLAIDVHFTPLLLELGATTPVRGLFVLEAETEEFPARAQDWVAEHRTALLGRLSPPVPAASPRA